ncbi:MAG: hypothetical protein RBU29_13725, partial [bacterium]|nr:hypothetical protein [bacterium]
MKSIQWTLAFSVFMVCGGFLPVTGAQTLVLPAGTGIAAVSPVVISTQTILAARERVTRVGWSETMIDTQQAAVPDGSVAWRAILKAALLGGEERMTAAIQAQVEELRALSQVTPLDSPSPSSESIPAASTISPFLSFEQNSRLLNANDVLKAIPEWTSIAADQKTQLHSLMQAVLAQPLLVLSEDSFTRLRQEVALWSRALIFDATQPADR